MKKVLASLLVLCSIASVSLAAVPVVQKAAVKSSNMNIGLGTMGVYNVNCFGLAIPLSMAGVRFATETYSGDVAIGMSSTSQAGTSNTTFGLGGKLAFNLTGGAVSTHAGAGLTYLNMPVGNVTATAFSLAAIYGAETYITKDFVVGVDIYSVSFTSSSAGGASSTNFQLLSGAVYGFWML